mmetsp:Transcript_85543/g.242526  ORF Transcript_85543/g.242526 Transcript_85543/m.242526 type:complete len:273 (+) Transcript_85543:93-911(+)
MAQGTLASRVTEVAGPTEEHVGAQHVLAAGRDLLLLLYGAEVALRVQQRQACFWLDEHWPLPGYGVEGAEAALEGTPLPLVGVEEDPEGVLRNPAVLSPHVLVRVPAKEVPLHKLLDPDDVVDAARHHAVHGAVLQEPSKPAAVPERLREERVQDVGPVEPQHAVPVLPAEALRLGKLDDAPALARREEGGQSQAVSRLEVDGLRKPVPPGQEGAHARRIWLYLEDLRLRLLHLLLLRRRLLPLRQLDLHVYLDNVLEELCLHGHKLTFVVK